MSIVDYYRYSSISLDLLVYCLLLELHKGNIQNVRGTDETDLLLKLNPGFDTVHKYVVRHREYHWCLKSVSRYSSMKTKIALKYVIGSVSTKGAF